jgi:type IV pilus assembly protein PilQ
MITGNRATFCDRVRTVFLLVLLAGFVAALPARPVRAAENAGETAGGPPRVTNMFYETSLRQALADIAAQTNTIIVPGMSVQGIVTCELKDVPLDRALEIVLSVGDYEFRHEDGYIFVGSADPESPGFAKLCRTRTLKMNYVDAPQAVKMLSESVRDYAQANPTTNTVCVTAPPQMLERIVGELRMLDEAPRQVMIEAKVVELERRALDRFGVDWNWEWQKPQTGENVRSGNATFDSLNWTLGLGYSTTAEFTRNLNMSLDLLKENESATIIADPHVVAADGSDAEVKVTTEEYFEIVTEDIYVRSELEVIESGIVLTMEPSIGENGAISMRVTPDVSNVIGQGMRGLPVITRRRASTTVRVQDGGTIIIAGLHDNRTRVDEMKVPLLGDIPLLGNLFWKQNAESQSRQVAIFITPRIVEDGARSQRREPPTARASHEPAGPEFEQELERLIREL